MLVLARASTDEEPEQRHTIVGVEGARGGRRLETEGQGYVAKQLGG